MPRVPEGVRRHASGEADGLVGEHRRLDAARMSLSKVSAADAVAAVFDIINSRTGCTYMLDKCNEVRRRIINLSPATLVSTFELHRCSEHRRALSR